MFSTAIRSFDFFHFRIKKENLPSSWNNLNTKQSLIGRCDECHDFFPITFLSPGSSTLNTYITKFDTSYLDSYTNLQNNWKRLRIRACFEEFQWLWNNKGLEIKWFWKLNWNELNKCMMMKYLNFPGLCNVVLILLIMASGLMVPHHTYVN